MPCFDVFEQIPGLGRGSTTIGIEASAGSLSEQRDRLKPRLPSEKSPNAYRVTEMGLFWAIDPDHQHQGYATEAAQALIDFAFQQLRVKRLIATTEYDNAASMGVMRRLGMHLEKNPLPDPPWLQVVGILEHPADKETRHG